jgi:hypothetical protein
MGVDGVKLTLGAGLALATAGMLVSRGSSNLEDRGRRIREAIAKIRSRQAEMERLLAELEAQAALMELGIDPQEVVGVRPMREKRWRDPSKDRSQVMLSDGREVEVSIPPKSLGWRGK